MLKKSVQIDESKNEIRYYEKDIIKPQEDYFDTILKYLCTSTETSENIKDDYEYKVLRNGKRLKDD